MSNNQNNPQDIKMFKVLIGYDKKDLKNMPVGIPWDMLNEEQAKRNHSQTLARLNERGGMCVTELLANIYKQDKRDWTVTQETVDELNKLVADFLNPQEVPQVKSVEEIHNSDKAKILFKKEEAMHNSNRGSIYHSNQVFEVMEEYAAPLVDRIAELERNEHSDAKHIASLEKQIKFYETIVDKHIISSANYTAEYINSVIAERDNYRDVIERASLALDFYQSENKGLLNDTKSMLKQALNSNNKQ